MIVSGAEQDLPNTATLPSAEALRASGPLHEGVDVDSAGVKPDFCREYAIRSFVMAASTA